MVFSQPSLLAVLLLQTNLSFILFFLYKLELISPCALSDKMLIGLREVLFFLWYGYNFQKLLRYDGLIINLKCGARELLRNLFVLFSTVFLNGVH